MLQIMNKRQSDMLSKSLWWVVDRQKAILMKTVVGQSVLLMQLTDLKNIWAARMQVNELMKLKDKYAKSIQIKQNKDLLLLFQNLLSFSDPEALYSFREFNTKEIEFTFQKLINIFEFKWIFKLTKISSNPLDIICKQILNPISFLLQCQTKRIQFIKIKFQQIEKQFLRKMTQMEKLLYKSPLIETQNEWKLIMPKYEDYKLNFIRYDDSSKYFYRQCIGGNDKNIIEQFSLQLRTDAKVGKKQVIPKKFRCLQQEENILIQEFESQPLSSLKKQKPIKKKQKKIDFI